MYGKNENKCKIFKIFVRFLKHFYTKKLKNNTYNNRLHLT